ncbi:conserved protein of unknown function [Ectopseudomonas oleovorans]|uniref:Uncharacterized protein n=1 Tax=Ectopseudomonas oleovorans TaxID=301 RepID=A0A653BCC4_ECTOL|nr:conserved protein of unknown function [Pseudomonas oleovorans]
MNIESALALAGIALAALLSALGYFLKTRIEAKKSARKVLYYLLEIRFSIRSSLIDPAEIYKEFSTFTEKEFAKREMEIDRPTIERLIGPLMLGHFTNLANAVKVELDDKVLVPYEEALSEFSQINPVLAYKLKGREQLQKVISHTSDYNLALETTLKPLFAEENSQITQEIFELSRDQAKESAKSLCAEIDLDIIAVAKNCGISDYLACRKLISLPNKKNTNIDMPQLTKHIDQYAAIIKEQSSPRI